MSPPNPLYSSVEPEHEKLGAVRTALSEVDSVCSGSSIAVLLRFGSRVPCTIHLASGDRMVTPLTSSPWLADWLPVVGGQPGGAREGS